VQHPLDALTDGELADIVAAVKKAGADLDLPIRLGSRSTTLGEVLRGEMATRPAFAGQGL
jgi:hypothetical protein